MNKLFLHKFCLKCKRQYGIRKTTRITYPLKLYCGYRLVIYHEENDELATVFRDNNGRGEKHYYSSHKFKPPDKCPYQLEWLMISKKSS